MKLSQPKENLIKEYVQHSLNHTNLELEVRILPSFYSSITREDFTNVIKRLKGLGLENITPEVNDSLSVSFYEEKNIRIAINGNQAINEYCENNDLSKIKDTLQFMEKKRFSHKGNEARPIDVRDYNFRVNLKEENIIKTSSKRATTIIAESETMNKFYRYKKRFSFLSTDKLFRFDLSLVKSSSKDEIVNPAKKLAKKDIDSRKRKLVIKPRNDKRNFNDWWNSLEGNKLIDLREEKFTKSLHFKNLEDSNTLNNPVEYEIEVEFICNEKSKCKKSKDGVYKSFLENLEIIVQAIQRNEFILSETQVKQIRNDFNSLTKHYRFTDAIPLSVTLDYEKSVELDYEDYDITPNIRKDYCITEKADGERDLLLVNNKGNMFLLNRQGNVKDTNCKADNYKNCLLDGEYVTKDVEGNNIRLFLVFDIYFLDGKDIRETIFMRKKKDIEESIGEKSRHEEIQEFLKNIKLNKGKSRNEFMIEKKNFLCGDDSTIDLKNLDKIRKLEETVRKTGEGRDELRKLKKDTKIFSQANKIMENIKAGVYFYKTDGLIFTPTSLKVGEGETKRNNYGGRWNRVFKWKPETENSIDFRVIFLRDEDGEYIEGHKKVGDDIKTYYKTKLYVGYSSKEHDKLNGLRIVNEKTQYSNEYSMVPFEPINPYIHNVSNCNLLGDLRCLNGDIIKDKTIVEFVYDKDEEPLFRWKPLRLRDNLMPNSFSTAVNVWNTTFYPLTTDMITTGNGIPDLCSKYYSDYKDKKSPMSNMAQFHNVVKKYLIQDSSQANYSLLDLGTGEGGDLFKWLGAKLGLVVGIEHNICNITNITKGACKRILEARETRPNDELLKNTYIIWGDASKRIKTNESGMDALNRYYIDVLWGNTLSGTFIDRYNSENMDSGRGICADGFDIVSSMFCMHYFFKNKEMLYGFLQNVSENLKMGGHFIATLFDGSKIFKLLEKKDIVETRDSDGKLCWSIKKNYKNTKLSSNESSLGMSIGVYVDTFHKEFEEYLVNLDFLKEILPKFGLKMEKEISFDKIYKSLAKGELKQELSDEGKAFSFLNTTIKITKTEHVMLGGGKDEKKSLISNFISSDFVEDEESDDEYELDIDDTTDGEDGEGEDGEGDEVEGEDDEDEKESATQAKDELLGVEELKEVDLDLSEDEEELNLNEVDLSGSEVDLSEGEVDLSGNEETNIQELQELNLGEIDLDEQRGGFKDEIISSSANNITDFTIENNSDAEVKMDLGFDNSTGLEDFDLSEINYNKAMGSQNINVEDNDPNVSNDSVKVIKIDADQNTLNMINK
jgi:hypothetical protein